MQGHWNHLMVIFFVFFKFSIEWKDVSSWYIRTDHRSSSYFVSGPKNGIVGSVVVEFRSCIVPLFACNTGCGLLDLQLCFCSSAIYSSWAVYLSLLIFSLKGSLVSLGYLISGPQSTACVVTWSGSISREVRFVRFVRRAVSMGTWSLGSQCPKSLVSWTLFRP